MMERDRALARRMVEARATPEPTTGCYLWTGALEGKGAHRGEGYAVVRVPGGRRKIKIIRALLGLTDPKMLACHTCNTPACVHEGHLYAGTASQNMQDRTRSGRCPHANRTHCRHGHLLDRSYLDHGSRVRYCSTCKALRFKRWYQNARQV